jgi:hypothetical protein
MAKLIPDAVLDEQLGIIATATVLMICPDTPTTYGNALSSALVTHVLTPTIGGGDFTAGDGDTSGRKLTLGAQAGLVIAAPGTATHYVLAVTAGTKLLLVGNLTSRAVLANDVVNFPATDVDEVRDLA